MIEEAKDIGKEILKDTKEVVIERFFSPMYFYFIMAWILCNWTFVYSLLFVESNTLKKYKVDYLLSFYPTNTFLEVLYNLWSMLIGPAFSTYLLIWWVSRLSEKSFERFEVYKSNKRTIQRGLVYTEKVKIAKEERKIRDEESDKNDIRYIDQEEFNTWLDDRQENIEVSGVNYLPSEVLYNTDYESYKEQLNEFLVQEKED